MIHCSFRIRSLITFIIAFYFPSISAYQSNEVSAPVYDELAFVDVVMNAEVLSQEESRPKELENIFAELNLALDNFWELLDDQDLDIFLAGVRHAARARLLLEQYLGEDIDDLTYENVEPNSREYRLRLIAKRTSELAGEVGRELWRQDYEDLQKALLRLSELDVMVKSFAGE